MSLKVTSNEIQIQNSTGRVKFTSNNKLIYPRYHSTGSVTVSTGAVLRAFEHIRAEEFLQLSVRITSCNGNVGSSLIGIEVPANGSIIIDVYARAIDVYGEENNGYLPAADTEYLGIALIGNQLTFKSCRVDYFGSTVTPTRTTSLTYTARIYSYL